MFVLTESENGPGAVSMFESPLPLEPAESRYAVHNLCFFPLSIHREYLSKSQNGTT